MWEILTRPPASNFLNAPWDNILYWSGLSSELNYIPWTDTSDLVYLVLCPIWDQVIPKTWRIYCVLVNYPPQKPYSGSWPPTLNSAGPVTRVQRMLPGWWNWVRAFFVRSDLLVLLCITGRINQTMELAFPKRSPSWYPEQYCLVIWQR